MASNPFVGVIHLFSHRSQDLSQWPKQSSLTTPLISKSHPRMSQSFIKVDYMKLLKFNRYQSSRPEEKLLFLLIQAFQYLKEPVVALVKCQAGVFISGVAPRTGLAWKHSIDVGAGVIDADYRGPPGFILFNHSDFEFKVKVGDTIAQSIIEKIMTPDDPEVD